MDRLTTDTTGKTGIGLTFDLDVSCANMDTAERLQDLIVRLGELEKAVSDSNGQYDIDRLRALAESDRDGRCVVLGEYPAKNRYDAADYLSDWIKEEEFEDRSVGIYAIQSDVGDVVHGVIDALNAGRSEAEAALKGENDGKVL